MLLCYGQHSVKILLLVMPPRSNLKLHYIVFHRGICIFFPLLLWQCFIIFYQLCSLMLLWTDNKVGEKNPLFFIHQITYCSANEAISTHIISLLGKRTVLCWQPKMDLNSVGCFKEQCCMTILSLPGQKFPEKLLIQGRAMKHSLVEELENPPKISGP